jgi:hypothetical protein
MLGSMVKLEKLTDAFVRGADAINPEHLDPRFGHGSS